MCANHALSGEIFYRKSRMTRSENYYPTLLKHTSSNCFLPHIFISKSVISLKWASVWDDTFAIVEVMEDTIEMVEEKEFEIENCYIYFFNVSAFSYVHKLLTIKHKLWNIYPMVG